MEPDLEDLGADVPELEASLADEGGCNLAVKEDSACRSLTEPGGTRGDQAKRPFPLLGDGITSVDITGTTAHTFSNTAANPGSVPKLQTLLGSHPDRYHTHAKLKCRIGTELNIRQLVDANNRPVFGLDSRIAAVPEEGVACIGCSWDSRC